MTTDLLDAARADGCEFGPTLANHLPMILVALDRLGASAPRMRLFAATYRATSSLAPPPRPDAAITWDDWTHHLGQRERETDFRFFFAAERHRLGIGEVQRRAMPILLPGIAASALHALMRLGYAHLDGADDEVATALAYWSATYLPLPSGCGVAETQDLAEILARLRALPHLRDIRPETDLLWHAMRSVGADPEFAAELDRLSATPDSLASFAAAALALDVASEDFCSLHALTSMHWLRLLPADNLDRGIALRHLWRALAAVYPKMGFPALPSAPALENLRHARCPEWSEIARSAVESDDEHDISLVFSAREEAGEYGDPLYRWVAARRMGLLG